MELSTLVPFLIMILLSVASMVYYEVVYFVFEDRDAPTEEECERERRRSRRQHAHDQLLQRYFSTITFLLFYLSIGGISSMVFQSITCVNLDSDNLVLHSPLVLWVDVSVDCSSSLHFYSVIWASLAIVVYVIGIPVSSFGRHSTNLPVLDLFRF